MRNYQQGVSLQGLIAWLFVLVIVGLLALKLYPPVSEFNTAKTAIIAIAAEKQKASVKDIQKAFEARSNIDDIKALAPQDLEITKEGGEVVISFAYKKEVPLFWNLGVYFDLKATSKTQE